MTTSSGDFLHRRKKVRDILLSFDRDTLPSEFKTAAYTSITPQQRQRPSSDWTIPGDLEGTLLTWGVHDDDCYNFLKRCQPSKTRAVLFHQKVQRRLRGELSKYDCLTSEQEPSSISLDDQGKTIRNNVRSIADTLRTIMDAAEVDRTTRYREGDNQLAYTSLFVETLEAVCLRHGDKGISGENRDPGEEESEASLFQIIIAQPRSNERPFVLDSLDRTSVHILSAFQQDLKRISIQLEALSTPEVYRQGFQRILEKTAIL